MHNFKKVFKATVIFSLCLIITSIIIICPCFLNGSNYNDSAKRKELSGEITYIFNGASHCLAAVNPHIIDQGLSVCSYNLSSSSASLEGRYTLLKKEIERNKVDTVVIDVSFDTLSRSQKAENATGEPMVICKLDTVSERINYLFSNVSFFNNDYENIYSIFLRYGLKAWGALLNGEFNTVQTNKGFIPDAAVDVSLKPEEIISTHNVNELNTSFMKENVNCLKRMVDLCKENDVRVVVAVIPISEARIWRYRDFDNFYSQLRELCFELDCEMYDFNLLKSRFELFSDEKSFSNETHMSEQGASAFSDYLVCFFEYLNEGTNVSDMFYSSYEEMKDASLYMEKYLEHNDTTE